MGLLMDIISTFLTIFVILLIGFIAKRSDFISESEGVTINKVVVNLAMPCLVFNSLYSENMSLLPVLGKFPIVGFITAFICFIISYYILTLMDLPDKQKWAIISVVIMGNTGFVGFPVISGVFGSSGLLRAIFFNITDVLMMVVVYLMFVIKFGGSYGKAIERIIRFPVLWALIIGVVFSFYNVSIGPVLSNVIKYLADMTIPLIILSLGLSMKFDNIRDKIGLTLTGTVLKLFLYPFISFFIIKLLGLTGFNSTIALVESAMPSAMLAISYVMEFKLDTELTSSIIVLDTLISLVTLPILISII